MKLEQYKELDFIQKRELSELFSVWLREYTKEVIVYVMNNKVVEILENEFAMHLLKELKEREEREYADQISSFSLMFRDLVDDGTIINDHCVHNHVLDHSKSYRDVLYDLYIRDMPRVNKEKPNE